MRFKIYSPERRIGQSDTIEGARKIRDDHNETHDVEEESFIRDTWTRGEGHEYHGIVVE